MLIPGQIGAIVKTARELRHSPHWCFKTVKFLRGFYYFLVLVGQNPSPKVETYIPIIVHLLQTALPTEQTAESNTFSPGQRKQTQQHIIAFISEKSDTIYSQDLLQCPTSSAV